MTEQALLVIKKTVNEVHQDINCPYWSVILLRNIDLVLPEPLVSCSTSSSSLWHPVTDKMAILFHFFLKMSHCFHFRNEILFFVLYRCVGPELRWITHKLNKAEGLYVKLVSNSPEFTKKLNFIPYDSNLGTKQHIFKGLLTTFQI